MNTKLIQSIQEYAAVAEQKEVHQQFIGGFHLHLSGFI